MKLVKIEDVRLCQIWKDEEHLYTISRKSFFGKPINKIEFLCDELDLQGNLIRQEEGMVCDIFFKEGKELVGFVGITHKIEDGKLIEIPREEFEKDDIIEINMEKYIIINISNFITKDVALDKLILGQSLRVLDSKGHYDEYIFGINKKDYKKIGTLGVNYEFINNKLVKENE